MEEFNQEGPIIGTQDLSFDEIDHGMNQLDIIHLFGKEKLEDIQKKLSKATSLAFVTVDYRGEPITEATFFTKFCRSIRNESGVAVRCKASDAFGSIQAAVTQKPSVYFCPCGLLEVAIPIVVRGHYLGGFIGGQVRCVDAPEQISRLEKVMYSDVSQEAVERGNPYLAEIPVYSYEKFLDIANLVFLIINQLSENEVRQHIQEEILNKRIRQQQALNQRYLRDNQAKERKIMELMALMNPYAMIDIMTSLVNLTIIENASRSNEVLNLFLDYTKYMYMEKETLIHISRELEQAERYLKIQKIKLGDRFEYSIQIPKQLGMMKIPAGVLEPFVRNAVYNGAMLNRGNGKVEITGCQRGGKICFEISDNGPGFTDAELEIQFEAYKDKHEGYYIAIGMQTASGTMKRLFGDNFDVMAEHSKGKGRKYMISWPEHFEERAE